MSTLVKLVCVLCILGYVSSSYLQANYFTDTASCSATTKAAELYVPVNKCIAIPTIPSSFNITIPFNSFKISTCTVNADSSVSTKINVYASSSTCSGLGVPAPADLPAGCDNGGTFSCPASIASSESVTNNWPAVGTYFGDSACKSFDLMLAAVDNQCTTISEDTSAILKDTDTSLNVGVYSAAACSGTPTKDLSMTKGSCLNANSLVPPQSTQLYEMALENIVSFFNKIGIKSIIGENEKKVEGSATVFVYGGNAKSIPGI